MKTLEDEIRYSVRFAQSHEDENLPKCDVCGKRIHPEEIYETDLFGDGKAYSLCDKHYEIYCEEN